jgi:hypothetical protein
VRFVLSNTLVRCIHGLLNGFLSFLLTCLSLVGKFQVKMSSPAIASQYVLHLYFQIKLIEDCDGSVDDDNKLNGSEVALQMKFWLV